MQEKEVYLKKILNLFFIYIIIFFFNNDVVANDNKILFKNKVNKYISNISEYSASFIQFDENSYQEGIFFIKNNRLRIEYLKPNEIVLVLKENKAMYYNKDLEEVEYFNPQNTPAEIFFSFFNDPNFIENVDFIFEKNSFFFSKIIEFENEKNYIKIYFEKSPIKLRKIEIKNSQTSISFAIINENFNADLEDKIFSLANPLSS